MKTTRKQNNKERRYWIQIVIGGFGLAECCSTSANDEYGKRQRRKSDFDVSIVPSDSRLVDVEAVAAITGLGVRTIHKLISGGQFPKPQKIGEASRWKLSVVEAWVRQL